MQRRNSYSDLGLIVAISVFVCIFVKSLLFGFTWVGIIWLMLSCAYFYVSWRYPSHGAVVKHSTTAYLLLSVVAIAGIVLFDQNARPVMHAFEGTGDTIQDAALVEEEPIVPIYEPQPEDTLLQDTAALEEIMTDSLLLNNVSSSDGVVNDSVLTQ